MLGKPRNIPSDKFFSRTIYGEIYTKFWDVIANAGIFLVFTYLYHINVIEGFQ